MPNVTFSFFGPAGLCGSIAEQQISSQGAEMKNSILNTLATLAVALTMAISITGASPNAQAQNSQDYVYCTLRDGMHSVVYYSDVFAGDYYFQSVAYSNAFTNYVHGQFSNVIGVASCLRESDPSRARSAEDGWRSSDRGIYRQLVDTRWTY
jgi:hypothetical protein